MPYARTVKTKSGVTAVQVVYSSRRGSRDIEHIRSAHDEAELDALKAAARQRMARGQLELGFGPDGPGPAITSSRMGCLLDALDCTIDRRLPDGTVRIRAVRMPAAGTRESDDRDVSCVA